MCFFRSGTRAVSYSRLSVTNRVKDLLGFGATPVYVLKAVPRAELRGPVTQLLLMRPSAQEDSSRVLRIMGCSTSVV